MSDIVIRAENLGKKYIIGHQADNGRYLTLRDVLARNARDLWRKTKDLAQGKPIIQGQALEEVWALRDVSFEVQRGQVLGIIGRNGAGKSTLLKVLSRITEPSAGRATIKGRVASLLEVGTGFHPELTGRENIYLNGAILGMSRAEIRRKYDEIVAFAEVEKFLDTPVKRYSSGMYVRLAFAVAAHLEPEILLVDEVLAVGDAAFQKKSLGKMNEVAKQGRTVLFVSHNMGAIEHLCACGFVLDSGHVIAHGSAREVVAAYLASIQGQLDIGLAEREDRRGNGGLRFTGISLLGEDSCPVQYAISGQKLIIRLHYRAATQAHTFRNCRASVVVQRLGKEFFLASTELVRDEELVLGSAGHLDCIVDDLPLSEGEYSLDVFLEANKTVEDWVEGACKLSVVDGDYYGTGRNYPPGWAGETVLVRHRWEW